jgi:diketogulonate reductase-like aldo/keto reductase
MSASATKKRKLVVDDNDDEDSSSRTEKIEDDVKTSATAATTTSSSRLNRTIKIGDDVVPAFGYGTLSLGVLYPDKSKRPTEQQSIEIIHALLDAGCRFFDTADTYCASSADLHYVEKLMAKAFTAYNGGRGPPSDLFVATKGGMSRTQNGENSSTAWMMGSNKDAAVKSQMRASHEALGGKRPIDLWQLHHVHGGKPDLVNNTLKAVRSALEMRDEGLVRYVGICNASLSQVEACIEAGRRTCKRRHHIALTRPHRLTCCNDSKRVLAVSSRDYAGTQECVAHDVAARRVGLLSRAQAHIHRTRSAWWIEGQTRRA